MNTSDTDKRVAPGATEARRSDDGRRQPRGRADSKVRAELVRLLGPRKAELLMVRFGGRKIRVPQPDLRARNEQVRNALDRPRETLTSVAERFQLSRRQVARIGKTT